MRIKEVMNLLYSPQTFVSTSKNREKSMEFAKLNCPAGNYPRYSPRLLTEIRARRIAEMRLVICNGLTGSAPFLFNVECPPFKQVRSRRLLRESSANIHAHSANTPCSFGEYSMLIRRIFPRAPLHRSVRRRRGSTISPASLSTRTRLRCFSRHTASLK